MVAVPENRSTLVSIGIPAYNVDRYLARALDSLLNQSISNFEIIISDNASTDGTGAICEAYARRDPRIRYIRQPNNIGAPRNWNVVVHESRGIFFKWASASDLCSPTMLEQCVNALQADSKIVLCYGKTQFIDENDLPLCIFESELGFEEDRPSDRMAHICSHMTVNNLQCGVFRLDTLRRTRLDRMYPSGDLALMAELTLYGRFKLLPTVLLYRRQSRETATSMLTPMERQRFYNPHATRAITAIVARRYMDNFFSILRAPISFFEKTRACVLILRLLWWDRAIIWRELRQ